MDGYQTVQNWTIFAVLVGGLAYYYLPKDKKPQKLALPQEVKKEAKKTVQKPAKKAQTLAEKVSGSLPTAVVGNRPGNTDGKVQQNTNKKRKANTEIQTQAAPAPAQDGQDEIDMSTRHFAEQMVKAQQGVDVKRVDSKDARVKTVKPKPSQISSPVLSSGSSQADEDDWTAAVSPALKAGGIDDMLEPVASGPTALRITPAANPVKERTNKPKKEEVVETKKQRQNRKKKEAQQAARAEEEKARKAQQEQTRRVAREARGEPAKNGIPAAPPATNQWTERSAARVAQPPAVVSSGSQSQLLDTFDVESNSSSNAEVSTAATSTTDHAPSNDFASEDDFKKTIDASAQEDGFTEVASRKKNNKKKPAEGEATPTATPVIASTTVPKVKATVNPAVKPVGFQALKDELEHRGTADAADPSNWDA